MEIKSTDKAITIQEFIALGSIDDITYYNFSILEYLNGFDMFVTNILYDYEDEFNDMVVNVKFTDLERLKYRYKPSLLSYDIYGSIELAFVIMMLNGIIDPKEFNFKTIKLIRPNDLNNILSNIYAANSEYINENRTKLKTDFLNNSGNNIWTE